MHCTIYCDMHRSTSYFDCMLQIEYDAMVPICSKALCPGKIIHTNEILVLLGENTFIECTAKDAAEIITHRLKSNVFIFCIC